MHFVLLYEISAEYEMQIGHRNTWYTYHIFQLLQCL
jgi:hypothetical protein